MKRTYTIILCSLILMLSLFCCSKKESGVNTFINAAGKEEQIHIVRFDKELFATPLPNLEIFLKNLQKKYPEMFQTSLDNVEYLGVIEKFVTDKTMLDVQGEVEKLYPNVDWLEKDLTSAFANLQKQHKDTQLPKKLFTMIFGPADFSYAFENRVYTNGAYSTISLDLYSMQSLLKNPYYQQIPQYMIPTLNKRFIAPDFMRMYIKNVTYLNSKDVQTDPDCTLLDYIVDEGKYTYILSQILPTYKENEILRYTEEQLQWCEDNEKAIWAYILQARLLYEKDRSKFMSLTAEGPTSKPLSDSPSRVGNFIGYQIVKKFMNNENISFDSLINLTDSQMILQKSNYKPKK